jgi:hypothetical protein
MKVIWHRICIYFTSTTSITMKPLKSKLILLLTIPMLFSNCDKVNVIDDDRDNTNCTGIACTMIYIMVVVNLTHSGDKTPYLLSSYNVIRLSDNVDITPKNGSNLTNPGYYVIASDSEIDIYKFRNVEVVFKGYFNSNLVVQRQFIITADCCHISLVQGQTTVSI